MIRWNGKKKAVTFSFDDAVLQDIDVIAIMNKYGLKGTFNLNSGLLGMLFSYDRAGVHICGDKIQPSQVKELYAGHEVAVHTIAHHNLTWLEDETVVYQVEEDRKRLEGLVGYPIVGMAYPCGGVNNDDRVASVIGKHTPIRYARTTTCTFDFTPQRENLLRYNPTGFFEMDGLEDLVERFLADDTDGEKLLYLWGHAYELDSGIIDRARFEAVCKRLSGHDDIFYGTNKEVLL
ncbi:MAG: polysaccharide deacetylase family protein [Clostridia bacterium]|nr:polysaccharide deacetylase family protein [Clostridia bacterium]